MNDLFTVIHWLFSENIAIAMITPSEEQAHEVIRESMTFGVYQVPMIARTEVVLFGDGVQYNLNIWIVVDDSEKDTIIDSDIDGALHTALDKRFNAWDMVQS